jgi:hypothetical protein
MYEITYALSSKGKIKILFDHFEEAAPVACTVNWNFGCDLHQDIKKPRRNLI